MLRRITSPLAEPSGTAVASRGCVSAATASIAGRRRSRIRKAKFQAVLLIDTSQHYSQSVRRQWQITKKHDELSYDVTHDVKSRQEYSLAARRTMHPITVSPVALRPWVSPVCSEQRRTNKPRIVRIPSKIEQEPWLLE